MLVRDVLLSLAAAWMYHARWTEDIHAEWTRNLIADRPDLSAAMPRLIQAIDQSIPDCLIRNHHLFISGIELPDPNDHHVLAAALAGQADTIVTFNLKDFPEEQFRPYAIEAVHPDAFVAGLLEEDLATGLDALRTMRRRWTNPVISATDLIARLAQRGLPLTATLLDPYRDALT